MIGRAVNSVLRQSLSCSEIIIIDDGSYDDTSSLVKELQDKEVVPIKYFRQENSGPAAARNLGIKNAQYEYIAFLDSDDHWHKKKLERQHGLMNGNSEYLISHSKEKWLRRGVHLNQKTKHIPRHGDIFEHCLELCAVGMSTVMARKTLFDKIGLFNSDLRCCEDYDMWLRASSRYAFLLVDAPLTIKEGGREDQVSYQYRTGMDKLRITSIENLLLNERLSASQRVAAQKELVKKARIYGTGCLRHGKIKEGSHYLKLVNEIENSITKNT